VSAQITIAARLQELLNQFKLHTFTKELLPRLQADGQEACLPTLLEVFELEAGDRMERRVDRLRRASKLPPGKTMATIEKSAWPPKVVDKIRSLRNGEFLGKAVNVLAFGPPGVGKSHAASAVGHSLVEAGHTVLFTPTYRLVQELLAAKRDLELPKALKRLDRYELVILDDIGYVEQSREEVEVLFTLIAERYERRSLFITSNLVFSDWERIFKDQMTTAAAIDRLVHHSVILELDVPSYRVEKAKARAKGKGGSPKKKTARTKK
jgi:DNA replication protein DnaC